MKAAYKKLIAWEKADALAKNIFKASQSFPRREIYCLTSQLRRAALSVVLNITEGHARNNPKEFYHFLRIAYASLAEVEYLLEFALDQKYLNQAKYEKVESLRKECGQVLWRLLRSQK